MNKEFILNTKLTDTQVALFYLGQEGFLFKYKETHILIDPYLSDYVDKNCCSDTVQWIRNYPAPIAAEDLDFIDYVLCTHTHYDHTDPYTLEKLAKANPNDFLSVIKRAPMLDVIIITVFLKFTVLPCESVNLPSSNICSNMFITSG